MRSKRRPHSPALRRPLPPAPPSPVVAQTDAIKAPLWDVGAQGPTAYPSNAAFVQQFTAQLLATSFPNLRPQQVQVPGGRGRGRGRDQRLGRGQGRECKLGPGPGAALRSHGRPLHAAGRVGQS